MYAIVEIAGKQFRVRKDMKVKVPRLESEPGAKIGFDKVLFVEDDKGNSTIGSPLVKNTLVNATIIEHGRDKKVIVFKKKRRKGYQKTQGHRQGFSLIEINTIGAGTLKKETPAVKPKTETVKTTAKPEVKAAPKAKAKPKAVTAAKPKTTAKAAAKKAPAKTTATKTKPAGAKAAKPKTTASKTAAKKPAVKKETKEE